MKSDNPHILTLSPPLNMRPLFFKSHCGMYVNCFGLSNEKCNWKSWKIAKSFLVFIFLSFGGVAFDDFESINMWWNIDGW